MRIDHGQIVPLGYGKYFKSDHIVGLEPIEEERGPGKRTWVYIEGHAEPVVASRSESAILRDLVEQPHGVTRLREQRELLGDILDSVREINPMLRSIIRDQGRWDLDRLEQSLLDAVADVAEELE
jgi:hypothetical protein